MGIFTMPIVFIFCFLWALFCNVAFTGGSLAFDQLWTNQGLENATQAAATQRVNNNGQDPSSPPYASVLNVPDAQNLASELWNAQNQTWTPTGQPIQANFTFSAQNPITPPGEYDTITGTVQVPVLEKALNYFVDQFDPQANANYGGTITDTVSSTLPVPQDTLPSSLGTAFTLHSSLPVDTVHSALPSDIIHSSLPSTTLHSTLPNSLQ